MPIVLSKRRPHHQLSLYTSFRRLFSLIEVRSSFMLTVQYLGATGILLHQVSRACVCGCCTALVTNTYLAKSRETRKFMFGFHMLQWSIMYAFIFDMTHLRSYSSRWITTISLEIKFMTMWILNLHHAAKPQVWTVWTAAVVLLFAPSIVRSKQNLYNCLYIHMIIQIYCENRKLLTE